MLEVHDGMVIKLSFNDDHERALADLGSSAPRQPRIGRHDESTTARRAGKASTLAAVSDGHGCCDIERGSEN